MDLSTLLTYASENAKTSGSKKLGFSTDLGKPKRAEPPKPKGVQSAAVRKFLEQRDKEEKKKEKEAAKKKEHLLKLRAEANTKKKAHAMASRTKDNFQIKTDDAGNVVLPDGTKDFIKKSSRVAHLDDDAAKRHREMQEKMARIANKLKGGDDLSIEKKDFKDSDSHRSGRKEKKHRSHSESGSSQPKAPPPEGVPVLDLRSGSNVAPYSPKDPSSRPHSKHRHESSDKKKHKSSSDSGAVDSKVKKKEKEFKKPKPKRKPGPPPPAFNFQDLLKMAKTKQHEPVQFKPKPKVVVQERPMTQEEKDRLAFKQTKEYKEWYKFGKPIPKKSKDKDVERVRETDAMNGDKSSGSKKHSANSVDSSKSESGGAKGQVGKIPKQTNLQQAQGSGKTKNTAVPSVGAGNKKRPGSSMPGDPKRARNIYDVMNEKVLVCGDGGGSEDDYDEDERPKKKGPQQPAQSTWDRIYGQIKEKHRRPPKGPAGMRIESDEEEEDDDMDDFIVDGDDDYAAEEDGDYSSAIQSIFGSRYKQQNHREEYYDDDGDDYDDMEAGFDALEREEERSAKIGMMEDLADMRAEAEHKKRKMKLKKMAMQKKRR